MEPEERGASAAITAALAAAIVPTLGMIALRLDWLNLGYGMAAAGAAIIVVSGLIGTAGVLVAIAIAMAVRARRAGDPRGRVAVACAVGAALFDAIACAIAWNA